MPTPTLTLQIGQTGTVTLQRQELGVPVADAPANVFAFSNFSSAVCTIVPGLDALSHPAAIVTAVAAGSNPDVLITDSVGDTTGVMAVTVTAPPPPAIVPLVGSAVIT